MSSGDKSVVHVNVPNSAFNQPVRGAGTRPEPRQQARRLALSQNVRSEQAMENVVMQATV